MSQFTNSSRSYGLEQRLHMANQLTGAVRLDRLQPEEVAWLWPGRIPLGRLTLLVGDPGLGKSLVTLDVAARLTRGNPWPDELTEPLAPSPLAPSATTANTNPQSTSHSPNPHSEIPNPQSSPGSVLLLTAEDKLTDTVLPRLQAAGADCSRIIAIPSVIGPSGTSDAHPDNTFRRDLGSLKEMLRDMPDCRLLIVDPVSAYVEGRVGSSVEAHRLLAPLAKLAHERNLAVLAVSHLRKKHGPAIYRTLGSLTFVSAARAAWLVARDPNNPDRRLMLPIKNNLAPTACGLAFDIDNYKSHPGGPPNNSLSTATIRWSNDPITTDPDTALRAAAGRPRTERDDAREWLQEKLAAGPLPARQVQDEAEAHGIRLITLRRAFRELKGEAVRIGYGDLGGWLWRLPNHPT